MTRVKHVTTLLIGGSVVREQIDSPFIVDCHQGSTRPRDREHQRPVLLLCMTANSGLQGIAIRDPRESTILDFAGGGDCRPLSDTVDSQEVGVARFPGNTT